MELKEHELLGHIVEDVYTGFRGRAIGHIEYMYGCNRIRVEPTSLLTDGTVEDEQVFDVQRVQLVEKLSDRVEPVLPTLPLGAQAKHKYTGFEGIIGARATWINHVPQVDLEPTGRGTKGELMQAVKFDEQDVEVIEVLEIKDTTAPKTKRAARKPGGPRDNWSCVPSMPSR